MKNTMWKGVFILLGCMGLSFLAMYIVLQNIPVENLQQFYVLPV